MLHLVISAEWIPALVRSPFGQTVGVALMALPPRKPKKQKRESRWRSPAYCNHLRSFACVVCHSFDHVEVAHVRNGTDCGMGLKPSDFYALPMCREHHSQQHCVGEKSFWAMHKIDPLTLAGEFNRSWPRYQEIAQAKRERGLI